MFWWWQIWIKTDRGHQKLSFETNYIDLWSFSGVLHVKNRSKKKDQKEKRGNHTGGFLKLAGYAVNRIENCLDRDFYFWIQIAHTKCCLNRITFFPLFFEIFFLLNISHLMSFLSNLFDITQICKNTAVDISESVTISKYH